jgi:acetyl esterase/lipase
MSIRRRVFLSIAAGLLAAPAFATQQDPEEIDLWPSPPVAKDREDGAERTNRHGAISHISRPRLNVYRPRAPNGTAVVVIAGGGCARVEAGTESTPACRWLQSIGITAFELVYRLPRDGFGVFAPFEDGQRAMRLVRSKASSYGMNPKKIGIMGFSAGAHLAGMTAMRPDALQPPPVDAADSLSARPDFAVLFYPVLTMMPPYDHTRSRLEIVGRNPDEAQSAAYSVERLANAHSPPTFLAQAEDDPVSPIENSLMMSKALRSVGVDTELHVFRTGGHGWGLGKPGAEVAVWPALFADWARKRGFLN